jgi:hypothetical protein
MRFWLSGLVFILNAAQQITAQTPDLRLITSLSTVVNETSGLIVQSPDSIWTLNDSGDSNRLYLCDTTTGAVARDILVVGAINTDWEELLPGDNDGYWYIGDFGNNFQNRTNLKLYRIAQPTTNYSGAVFAESINFSYEDQTAFPPPLNQWYFDCEAAVVWGDSIFLFTKDWTVPLIGFTRVFWIPKSPGTHVAQFVGTFYTDNTSYPRGGITGATLSPDKSRLVLISNRKMWVFYNYAGKQFLNGSVAELDFPDNLQKEAVAFAGDACTLYVTDEVNASGGGNLYSVDYCDFINSTNNPITTTARAWATPTDICWLDFAPQTLQVTQSNGQTIYQTQVDQATCHPLPPMAAGWYVVQLVSAQGLRLSLPIFHGR